MFPNRGPKPTDVVPPPNMVCRLKWRTRKGKLQHERREVEARSTTEQSSGAEASNRRTQFRRALFFEPVDPVPFTIKFTAEARDVMSAYYGRTFEPIRDTGCSVVASHTNNGWEEVRPGYFRDYFGVVWNRNVDRTLGIVEDPPVPAATLGSYRFPDCDRLPVYGFVEENNRRYPDLFHMVSIGFTLFERAWSLVGMENLLIFMITEEAFVHDLLDRITEYNIALIRNAAAIGGLDAVHFGDDWGSQGGLLFSKDMWRSYIGPRLKRTCDAAHEVGLLVSQHSCGKVQELIPDMIDAGIDVFDPFQPEVMDVREVFARYHGKIAFWGGLSVQQTLPHGSPADVRAETLSLIQDLGSRGGYILSPSHSLTGDVPPENVQAFLDVASAQDRYFE